MPRHNGSHGVHHSTKQKGSPKRARGRRAKQGSSHVDRYANAPRQAMPRLANSELSARGGDPSAA